MAVGGAMVVAVGYALVINMMATRDISHSSLSVFALAAISQLTFGALGVIGVACLHLPQPFPKQGGNGGGGLQLTIQSVISRGLLEEEQSWLKNSNIKIRS